MDDDDDIFWALVDSAPRAPGPSELYWSKQGFSDAELAAEVVQMSEERRTLVTAIYLGGNRLTEASWPSIFAFPRVKWLYLGSNCFTSIPEEIAVRLTELHDFHVDGNRLAWLPSSLADMKGLFNISTEQNPDLPADLQCHAYYRDAAPQFFREIVARNDRLAAAARAASVTWLCVAKHCSVHRDPARRIAELVYSTRRLAIWDIDETSRNDDDDSNDGDELGARYSNPLAPGIIMH